VLTRPTGRPSERAGMGDAVRPAFSGSAAAAPCHPRGITSRAIRAHTEFAGI